MKFCPNCGTLTYEETEICPGCGEPFRDIKRYCPNCGNEISPGDHYCMYCGTDVSGIPSMLNGSTDKRSNQKPKKPKRHRIRRFLIRLFEILLILAVILWCFAYYEDYDLRLKVYDMIQSTFEIVPSVKTVLGISDEEASDEEPDEEGTGDNDDETIIIETPGDARKVDIVTIVIVNQAREAAVAAESGSEDDIDPDIEAFEKERTPERAGSEHAENTESGDISEFSIIGEYEGAEEDGEADNPGEIGKFRSFREFGEPDKYEMPNFRERRHERQRPHSSRSDRPRYDLLPPEGPTHGSGRSGSEPE